MPLLVHCPNRCEIEVPVDRVGCLIRCTVCDAPIKIPDLDSPLLKSGEWVECRAKRAIKISEIGNESSQRRHAAATRSPSSRNTVDNAGQKVPSKRVYRGNSNRTPILRSKPWRVVEPLTEIEPEESPPAIDLRLGPETNE